MDVKLSEFKIPDILNILSNLVVIGLIVFLHIQTNCAHCRGQLMTKTKLFDGQTCTREAKLSIHETAHPTELQILNRD